MTSTERVLAAINFRPPDRLPIWDVFWDTFPDKWRRYMGFDASVNPEDYSQIRHLTRDGCLWLAGKRRNRNLMAGENRLEGRITDFAVSRLPCKLIFRTQLPNPRAILPLDFGCDFAVGYSFGLSRKWGAGR